jgi:hypothetical protein
MLEGCRLYTYRLENLISYSYILVFGEFNGLEGKRLYTNDVIQANRCSCTDSNVVLPLNTVGLVPPEMTYSLLL